MKYIAMILIVFALVSCKDDSIFVRTYDKNIKNIHVSSLSFKTDNYYLLDKVERSFKKLGFKIGKNSKFHIDLTSHYVISCKNPVVHALGADFNGYIRLSFFKGKKEIYRIQKDFKSKVTDEMIDKIVKRMVKDIGLAQDLQ